MADFEELWNSTPASSAQSSGDSFEALWNSTPATPSGLNAVSGQIGKGLTLGWFDEIQGVEAGARNALLNLFGGGNEKDFSQNYQETVDSLRARDAAYEEANPWTSAGLQFGGALIPSAVTGGIGAISKGALSAGRGVLPWVARNVFGAGMAGAPTVGQLAKLGAISGAITGAGEANEGNRLAGSLFGGGVGAVAAPVIGKTAEYGLRKAGDALAELGINPYKLLESTPETQRGSFSAKPKDVGYTPEELFLARQLKNTPTEQIESAAADMAAAQVTDVPLFLPEALQSAKVDRNARFIANYEPSMEFSQAAIKARTEAAPERALSLFNLFSDEADSFAGASRLSTAADEIVTAAEAQRNQIAEPLYKSAYSTKAIIESDALNDLVTKDKNLARAISSVKKSFEYADLPDNATQVLVQARSELGDMIEKATTNKAGREARALTDTYGRLNKILHSENPELALADLAYSHASGEIENLTDTFLGSLRNLTGDKVQNVNQIFNLPEQRIAGLRQTFKEAGKLDDWNAGIRSYMQNAVEGTKDGRNFADKLIGNTLQKKKLKAALGSNYDEILRGLEYEDRMFVGKNKYHTGSTTYGNLAEESDFKRATGVLSSLKEGNWLGALASFFSDNFDDTTAKALARIYFDPKVGKEKIAKILPLVEQYAKNQAVAGAVGKSTGIGAVRESASPSGQQRQSTPLLQRQQSLEAPTPSPEQRSSPGQTSTNESSYNQDIFKPVSTQADDTFFNGATNRSLFTLLGGDKAMVPSTAQDIAAVEAQIDADPYYSALYEAESGRNPKAKNPKSTASGGFQFINDTAKSLGLEDPFDLAASLNAVQKLTNQHREQFGDNPMTLYAAHYLGSPLLAKWLSGKNLTEREQELVRGFKSSALPRFKRIYEKVLKGVKRKDLMEI